MPSAPVRFLHAVDVRLDAPQWIDDAIPQDIAPLIEEATLSSWLRLVTAAIDRDVHFLLLTGTTFIEDDRSLAARLALLDGLRQLDEKNIPVFVLPSPHDPCDAWRSIPGLPENVTLFEVNETATTVQPPVAVMHEGRVIASVTAGTATQLAKKNQSQSNGRAASNGTSNRTPVEIAMLHGDANDASPSSQFTYVATSNPRRQTNRDSGPMVHSPGCLQGLSFDETGRHGASLLEVGVHADLEETLLPVAVVQYDAFEVVADAEASHEDLYAEMARLWRKKSSHVEADLRCVNWRVRRDGEPPEWLSPANRQALEERFLAEANVPRGQRVRQTFEITTTDRDAHSTLPTALETRYRSLLDEQSIPVTDDWIGRLRSVFDSPETEQASPAFVRLAALLPDVEPTAILESANQFGSDWLRGE